MARDELAFAPAWKQAELVAAGEVSPVELVEIYLGRIERFDGELNSYITVAADQAMDAARAAEDAVARGDELGPLHGVPISIKDLELTAGIRSTLGSPALSDYVPDGDSVVVERVRRSGAVIIGKTNTPEIAISMATVTDSPLAGFCRNPWDLTRTTGGSSGGSAAAVSAGLCALATGTDGGGSIRIPASFCGVFGYKGAHGRVPRGNGYGVPDPNQFAQSGPMTRDVRDAAILFGAMSGPDVRDPNSMKFSSAVDVVSGLGEGVSGLKIGWSPDFGYGVVDPRVIESAEKAVRAFEELGCIVEEVELPLYAELIEHFWTIFSANAYSTYGHLLEDGTVGEDGREALTLGKGVSGFEYARALRATEDMRVAMAGVMDRYDLIASPTNAIVAFDPDDRPVEGVGRVNPRSSGEGRPPVAPTGGGGVDLLEQLMEVGPRKFDGVYGYFPFTYVFNMTGQPAATLPCGFVDGLPVGLQIAGKNNADDLVMRASAAFEGVRPWGLGPARYVGDRGN